MDPSNDYSFDSKKENFVQTPAWQAYIFGKFDVLEESHFAMTTANLHERNHILVIATYLTKFLMLEPIMQHI